jgi:hypothetical protein
VASTFFLDRYVPMAALRQPTTFQREIGHFESFPKFLPSPSNLERFRFFYSITQAFRNTFSHIDVGTFFRWTD